MKMSQVSPELRAAVRRVPPVPYGVAWARRLVQSLIRLAPIPKIDGVEITAVDEVSPGLRLYRPAARRSNAALLWIHGGGFVIGGAAQDDRFCAITARDLGLVVVSTDYRLAPEHPFPAALDDCHQAWRWLQRSAAGLGVDPSRIVVGGQSAGGGLAACLVQRLHDGNEGEALGQWLFSPMADDRTAARRELDRIDHHVWNNRKNAFAWRAFLAAQPGAEQAPPYAVAARREDLRGLPAAWIGVGEIDLFCEEDRRYAERLMAAGTPVALTTVAGAPHGFESWAPDTDMTRTFLGEARDWLRARVQPQ